MQCRRAEPDPSRIPRMIRVSNAMDRNMLYATKVPKIPRDNYDDRQCEHPNTTRRAPGALIYFIQTGA
jgi:hypothetical protein